MRSRLLTVLLGSMVAVVGIGAVAFAQSPSMSMQANQNVKVDSGQVVDSSYYAAGNSITISGTIKGDLYCAGQNIYINGTVDGDVLCAGQTIRVNGTVKGDVRAAGQTVDIEGTVAGAVTTFSQNTTILKGASVGTDLNGASQAIMLNGTVGRDVTMASNSLDVNGVVGRNISGAYETLSVLSGASVKGSLYYTSDNVAQVSAGTVSGESKQTIPQHPRERDDRNENMFGFAVFAFFSLLLISIVIALVAPQLVHTVTENGVRRLLMSLLVGFFVLFATPIVALLVGATVIGLPLAGLIMLVWLVTLAISGPMFAYYLGRVIMQKRTQQPILIMLVGATVLLLSYFVPIANIFTVLAAAVIGSGMVALELGKRYKKPHYKVK